MTSVKTTTALKCGFHSLILSARLQKDSDDVKKYNFACLLREKSGVNEIEKFQLSCALFVQTSIIIQSELVISAVVCQFCKHREMQKRNSAKKIQNGEQFIISLKALKEKDRKEKSQT